MVQAWHHGHGGREVPVTGAMDSSPEGNRTGSGVSFIGQSPVEKPSHRGPGAAAANRTLMGANIEARLAVEAQCRAAQWQM